MIRVAKYKDLYVSNTWTSNQKSSNITLLQVHIGKLFSEHVIPMCMYLLSFTEWYWWRNLFKRRLIISDIFSPHKIIECIDASICDNFIGYSMTVRRE